MKKTTSIFSFNYALLPLLTLPFCALSESQAEILRINKVVTSNGDTIELPVTKLANGDVCTHYISSSTKETYTLDSFCDKGIKVAGQWQPERLLSVQWVETQDGLGVHLLSTKLTKSQH